MKIGVVRGARAYRSRAPAPPGAGPSGGL